MPLIHLKFFSNSLSLTRIQSKPSIRKETTEKSQWDSCKLRTLITTKTMWIHLRKLTHATPLIKMGRCLFFLFQEAFVFSFQPFVFPGCTFLVLTGSEWTANPASRIATDDCVPRWTKCLKGWFNKNPVVFFFWGGMCFFLNFGKIYGFPAHGKFTLRFFSLTKILKNSRIFGHQGIPYGNPCRSCWKSRKIILQSTAMFVEISSFVLFLPQSWKWKMAMFER